MSRSTNVYDQYRAEVVANELPRSVVSASLVVGALNTGFVVSDWFVFPELFGPLLMGRIALNIALLSTGLSLSRRAPVAAAYIASYSTGLLLLFAIYLTGGVSGQYYPGLVLMFAGLPVLLPLSARQGALVVGALLAVFASLPWLSGVGVDWSQDVHHLLFPLGGAIECVAACKMLEGLRFRDFQRRQEIEEARGQLEDLDRAKSRFTANLHHELRTPLTLMLAPLDAIRGGYYGYVPPGFEQILGTMQANGSRLLRLINDLLDLAKIESGQLEISRSLVDPVELARSVVEGARPMAERKGVAISCLGPSEQVLLYADRSALEKVVVNLLGNALKFTEHGSVVVSVWPAAAGEESRSVQIDVQDTGVGIPPAQLDKIFDRFAQVDGSATRRHEGTGIGLSLVVELVELHGGRVWAESEGEGRGSTMHVLLPYGECDQQVEEGVLISADDGRVLDARRSFEALATEASDAFSERAAGREGQSAELDRSVRRWEGHRETGEAAQLESRHPAGTPEIVVADDNAEMRELLGFLIGREYVVRLCRNGREALEAVRERLPMLVVTDVMMPEMSGTELCQAIKEDPALRGVPVMLVTSKAEREMKIEGLEQGADDYVTKPFHPRELLARVRSLVRVRQLQAEVANQNDVLEQSNRELEQALRELKDAEVQLVQSERLAAVGELSAGVAHEVNNPLNFARNSLVALRSYVQDLQDVASLVGGLNGSDAESLPIHLAELERKKSEIHFDELSGDLGELVGIVTEGLDRTSKLVGDLRDFAAPHRGERVPVDLNASLESTLQLTRYKLRESGCEVKTELSAAVSPVLGDPSALNQVILNLLKNAAEALDGKGGGVLTVSTAEERGLVQVLVQDDGPGMDSSVKSRLFEPFFTTKKAGDGTGLGLSMCARIVHEHGGEISVESEPGVGTRVLVEFPALETSAGSAHGV